MACAVMAGVAQTEDRERSGIFSSAAGLLAAYRSEAALATTKDPNFDPAAFAASTDALYICAPSHAQERLAPIVVALLEQIRSAVYARPAGAAPVVFALDEVAGIAPLPSLPSLAAEGASQGLVTLACLQDLSQARARWGAQADGFFSLFNSKVIFPGIADHQTLSLVSALAGDQVVPVRSTTSVHPLVALISPSGAIATFDHQVDHVATEAPDRRDRTRPTGPGALPRRGRDELVLRVAFSAPALLVTAGEARGPRCTPRSPRRVRSTSIRSEAPHIVRATRTRAHASCGRTLTPLARGSGSTTAPPLSSSASPRRHRSVLLSEPNSFDHSEPDTSNTTFLSCATATRIPSSMARKTQRMVGERDPTRTPTSPQGRRVGRT